MPPVGLEQCSGYNQTIMIEMLAQASADARQRAEKIAQNAGGKLGKLRSATIFLIL